MKETDIQLQIIHYLKRIGAKVGKTRTMGVKRGRVFCFDPYTFRGKCDLEAFKNNVMYGIEVKKYPNKIKEGSDQDKYRKLFHFPPSRIFIEAHSLDDIMAVIK
jgi:hypothetical protein